MLSNNFHARIQLLVQSLRENSIVIESRKRISMAKSIIINPRPGVWGERRLRELKNFYFRSFPDSTKHVEHGALGMGLQVSFSIEWPWNGINVGHDTMSNDWPALLMHTWSCIEPILLFLIPLFGAVFSIYLSSRVYFILLILPILISHLYYMKSLITILLYFIHIAEIGTIE